jgi:hypothetical protein
MTFLSRPSILALATLAAGACVVTWQAPGLSVARQKQGELERALDRERQLDDELAGVLARAEARLAVAEGVAAGRLTLLEAAARLRDLRALEHRKVQEAARFRHRTLTEVEDYCREVIERVEGFLENRPAEAQAAVARLEVELAGHRAAGTLRLRGPRP